MSEEIKVYKDALGRVIEVGDCLGYAIRCGNGVGVKHGIVLQIKDPKLYGRNCMPIKVLSFRKTYKGEIVSDISHVRVVSRAFILFKGDKQDFNVAEGAFLT